MPTLTEIIFSEKIGKKVKPGDIIKCEVNVVMSHDNTTPLAIQSFKQITNKVFDPEKIVIVFDHIYPAANIKAATNQDMIRKFAREQKLPNLFIDGICHQIMIEKGFVKPGSVIIGGDSHSCSYGALGSFGTGMGSTDIAVAWATGKNWFRIPETIGVNLRGELPAGVYPKDVILHLAKIITAAGAKYQTLEFFGSFVDNLEVEDRITLSNMAIEMGAKAGLIAPDEKTINFLQKQGVTDKINIFKSENPAYIKTINLDVSTLKPQIACPHQVDNVVDLPEVAGTKLDQIFIGTCTNGRLHDLKIAAEILKGKKIHQNTRLIVIPASNKIYQEAAKLGLIDIFMEAGATVSHAGCGPCIGRHMGVMAAGETALTTMNRNFMGRMGSPESKIYLASPATAACSALSGEITNFITN